MPSSPEVSPELAQKALQADLRNTLQNVAQGDTLPPAKRQLFLGVLTDQAAPDVILQSRESALLRKFAAGARLKKEELGEIAHLLPSSQAPYSRTLTENAYRKTFAEYATLYAAAARTVKWWVAQGKKNPKGPELPPLDAPALMPEWWVRNMKQRCPDNLLSAARADHAVHPTAAAASQTPPSATNGSPPPPAHRAPVFVEPSSGFELNLRNNRQQLALAYQELLDAQGAEPRDNAAIELARRRWMQLDAAVQKAEEKAPDIFEKTGRLIDRDELAATLSPMISAAGESIRSMLNRVRPRLRKAVDESEEDAIWQAAVDEIFAELHRSGYTAPFHLQAA